MAKTLNELGQELKALILSLSADNGSGNVQPEKFNNLKLSMDLAKEPIPHVKISIGISEAVYDINTLEKMDGSLAQSERYVQRWFNKSSVAENLKACWKKRVDNRGKITEVED